MADWSKYPSDDDLIRGGRTVLETQGESWSPEARTRLGKTVDRFTNDMIDEAVRLARKDGVQQVAENHVANAEKRLQDAHRTAIGRISGLVAGACLGALVGRLCNMLTGTTPSASEVVVMVILAGIGCTLASLYYKG